MANKKKKTISGAMYSKPNLEHNLREHIPPNSVEERRYLNLVYTKDEDGNLKPQMKRDRYGGADWVETQKAVLQDMMLREFGWERFYKGSNPRGNLLLSDYRREKAAEMAKEEERKLDDIKDKVATGQVTIQAQAEQLEVMLESLDKGAEAERRLIAQITRKSAELDEVLQDLTDKKSEVREQEQKITLIKEDAEVTVQKAHFAEELIDYFKNTNSGDREKAYFEKMIDLRYENECLKQQNEELKTENRTLKAKLEKACDFMRQFTISGMNMLEHFLRSIGEWVQQKVAGMNR